MQATSTPPRLDLSGAVTLAELGPFDASTGASCSAVFAEPAERHRHTGRPEVVTAFRRRGRRPDDPIDQRQSGHTQLGGRSGARPRSARRP